MLSRYTTVRARVQASVFPTGPKGHCDQTLQSDLPGSHLYSLPAVTTIPLPREGSSRACTRAAKLIDVDPQPPLGAVSR
jgi:hypothetical protein